MNYDGLTDATTAGALDLAWLAAQLEPVSEYGARVFEKIEPFARGREAAAQASARRIAHAAEQIDDALADAVRDVLRRVPDIAAARARARMGDVLDDAAFVELLRFCDACTQLTALVAGASALEWKTADGIDDLRAVLERGRAGQNGFYLDERFDARLADTRVAARTAQASYDAARRRLAERVAGALSREGLEDEFIVMRADLIGGLPAGVRAIREAPTYLLCALELDEPALEALRIRDVATQAVAIAEAEVRAALSLEVRTRCPALDEAAIRCGHLDVLVAQARFARRFSCVPAEIVADGVVEVRDARFLPLEERLLLEGRTYAPIAAELDGVCVLTGPNMGGKSVALQTCGAIAAYAALGLPVPAASARVALFERIAWLGIGSDAELGGVLSSFAKEVVRLRDVLARASERTLALVDEFARTTTPQEGRALLIATIERLRAAGACAFVATHLAGVAGAARARHYTVRGLRDSPQPAADGDLEGALASLARSMDYTLIEVAGDEVGAADAIALAALLGLDREFIQSAYVHLKERPWIR